MFHDLFELFILEIVGVFEEHVEMIPFLFGGREFSFVVRGGLDAMEEMVVFSPW